jgi:hypothetical protein
MLQYNVRAWIFVTYWAYRDGQCTKTASSQRAFESLDQRHGDMIGNVRPYWPIVDAVA